MSVSEPEAGHKLETAFAHLPWIQREIFMLHHFEGLTYREIAWLLRVSERTVERQMSKAIYKLARQMDGFALSWWERWF